jgi:hypothetical protein
LWRCEQHLNLGLHGGQGLDQAAHIDGAETRGMEQKPSFDSHHSQAERDAQPHQALGKITAIVSGMDYEHLASQRHTAEILAQIPQIAPENSTSLCPEPPA